MRPKELSDLVLIEEEEVRSNGGREYLVIIKYDDTNGDQFMSSQPTVPIDRLLL